MKKNIDIEKIKCLIERLESDRLTLNEYNEKKNVLLVESSGIGGILRYVENGINKLPSLRNGESLRAKLTQLKTFISDGLSDIGKYINTTGSRFPDGQSVKSALKSVIQQFITLSHFQNKTFSQKDLLDYIFGVMTTSEKKSFLMNHKFDVADLNYMDYLADMAGKVNSYADYLNMLSPLINGVSTMRGLNGLELIFDNLLKSGIAPYKSLADIERVFKELDAGIDIDGEIMSQIMSAWETAKYRGNIGGLTGKEIVDRFKTQYMNSPKYVTAKEGFMKRWKMKNQKKGRDIQYTYLLKELKRNKSFDWNKTIVYFDTNKNQVILITFKKTKDFDAAKASLKKRGVDYNTPRSAEEGATGANSYQKSNEKSIWYQRKGILIVVVAGVGYGIYYLISCYLKTKNLTSFTAQARLDIDAYNKAQQALGKEGNVTTTPWEGTDGIGFCAYNAAEYTVALALGVAELFSKNTFEPLYAVLSTKINRLMDVSCPNCKCEFNCDDDTEVETWIESQKDGFGEELNNIVSAWDKSKSVLQQMAGWDEEKANDQLKKLMSGANSASPLDDKVATSLGGIELVGAGGIVTLKELVKKSCNIRETKCIADDFNKVFEELLPTNESPDESKPPQDCDGLTTWNNERIEKINGWVVGDKLFVGNKSDLQKPENEGKVVILLSKLKKTSLNNATTIDDFQSQMRALKQEQELFICNQESKPDDPIINQTETPIDTFPKTGKEYVDIRSVEGMFDGWICTDGVLTENGENLIKNKDVDSNGFEISEQRKQFWVFMKEELPEDYNSIVKLQMYDAVWKAVLDYVYKIDCKIK
jgi:hypothetical protein